MNMPSLWLRNFIFTVLHPGLVAGLFPYWILGDELGNIFNLPYQLHHFIGLILFLSGVSLLFYCIFLFVVMGHGTLSPADPTQHLVAKGVYQYSRNPMYIGVLVILTGEVIFTISLSLLLYTMFIFIMFNLFIIYIEEPRLRRDFGAEYSAYTQKVRRWI
jgi:protein-S-isoprenylcysteine O-methyltransferase Ste14